MNIRERESKMTEELKVENVLNDIWVQIEKAKEDARNMRKNHAYIKGLEHAKRIVEQALREQNGEQGEV